MSGFIPTSFALKRDSNICVTISKPGYEAAIVQVNHQTATAAVSIGGNIICGGIIGGAINCMTRATQELVPNLACVKLIPCRNIDYCNY